MAPPKAQPKITLKEQVRQLAAINCTWLEIAAVLGMKERTLRRRYGQTYKKGRESGKMSLKRKMYETAMNGHVTMMIWLSKQMLGYTDKVEQRNQITGKDGGPQVILTMSANGSEVIDETEITKK